MKKQRLVSVPSLVEHVKEYHEHIKRIRNPRATKQNLTADAIILDCIGIIESEPTADVVSREEYEEVIAVKVGEAPEYMAKQLERKNGKWIYMDNDGVRYDDYKCSVCHKTITVDAERYCDIGFVIEDMCFCPNCGADMRERKSNE